MDVDNGCAGEAGERYVIGHWGTAPRGADPIATQSLFPDIGVGHAGEGPVVLSANDGKEGIVGRHSDGVRKLGNDALVFAIVPGSTAVIADEDSAVGTKEKLFGHRRDCGGVMVGVDVG